MKQIITLLGLAVFLSSLVFAVGSITRDRTKYKNDFTRIRPAHAVDLISVAKTEARRFSLAGFVGNCLYLKDRSNRGGLIEVGPNQDTAFIPFDIPSELEVAIDSPYFYLQNGNSGTWQRGNVENWCVDTVFHNLPIFTAIQPVSKNSAVLRVINMQKRKNVFLKSTDLHSQKDILQKQVDGILCTDGYLQYSKEYHRLIYTYRYRNQFLILDSMLNIQLTGKTIDTTSIARISVSETDDKITMSKPPFVVNKGTCTDGKYLFVHSNLVAKNESVKESSNHSTIDVYNILDGSYLFSFYIDHIEEEKMQNFQVKDTALIAMFNTHIARYGLPSKYLP